MSKILIILIIVIAAGAGGYFVWQQIQQPGVSDQASETQSEIEELALSEVEGTRPELVEGWQIYRNEELRVEFKFPDHLEVGERDSDRGKEIFVFDPEFRNDPPKFAIQTFDSSPDSTLFNIAKQRLGSESIISTESLKDGILVQAKTLSGTHFFQKDIVSDHAIEIHGTGREFFLSSEFSQILSTFKFIEPAVDTSNWKTYIKEKETYGIKYRVSYPPDWTPSSDEYFFSIKDKDGAIFTIETPPLGFGIDTTVNSESVLVDGRKAVKIEFEGGGNRDRILVQFQERSLENIQILFNAPKGYNSKIFDDILTTFKFIQ